MNLFELVFLLLVLGLVIGLVRLTVHVARRKWRDARRLALSLAGVVVVYLAVVVLVSLATPREWVAIGEEQRFDDWCVSVDRVERIAGRYRLDIRVASRARGRPQRAADAQVVLVAADGRQFGPVPAPSERSLQSVLQPGESFVTVRDYDVPADASILGVDVIHGAWPGWFIVGDRGSILHQRPLVRVEDGALTP
jgi:hypothetical protein